MCVYSACSIVTVVNDIVYYCVCVIDEGMMTVLLLYCIIVYWWQCVKWWWHCVLCMWLLLTIEDYMGIVDGMWRHCIVVMKWYCGIGMKLYVLKSSIDEWLLLWVIVVIIIVSRLTQIGIVMVIIEACWCIDEPMWHCGWLLYWCVVL